MTLPLALEGFVIKPFDHSKPWGAGNTDDILPLFVPLQNFLRQGGNPFSEPAMLVDLPHTIFVLYQIRYGKTIHRFLSTIGVKRC